MATIAYSLSLKWGSFYYAWRRASYLNRWRKDWNWYWFWKLKWVPEWVSDLGPTWTHYGQLKCGGNASIANVTLDLKISLENYLLIKMKIIRLILLVQMQPHWKKRIMIRCSLFSLSFIFLLQPPLIGRKKELIGIISQAGTPRVFFCHMYLLNFIP